MNHLLANRCLRLSYLVLLALPWVLLPMTAQAMDYPAGESRPVEDAGMQYTTLPPALITDDPRLAERINLLEGKTYYLGELLEEISRQTGVSILANDADAASGKPIAVVLRDVPLSDAMNALWSLLSHQKALWHWNRTGKPGAFTYRLTRSSDARQYGILTRQRIQKAFEDEAELLIRGVDMTEAERSVLAKTNPRAASYLAEERTRNGLRFFASLPPETKQRLLRGEEKLRFPIEELSPLGKSFATATWRDEGLGANSTPVTHLTIKTQVSTGEVSPWLCIGVGDAESTIGTGYVGGAPFEAEWQERLAADWQLPDDKTGDARQGKELRKPKATGSPVDTANTSDLLVQHLSKASQAAPFSSMARVPSEPDDNPTAPAYGKTLDWYLGRLSERDGMRHKWRDGILLLEYRGDLLAEESATPWSLVKELRATEAKTPGRVLPLSLMANVAWRLTPTQLRELSSEFPIMKMVAEWRETMIKLNRSPARIEKIVSERGLSLADARPFPPVMEQKIATLIKQGNDVPVYVQISKNEHLTPDGQQMVWLTIHLLDKNGKMVSGQSYEYDRYRKVKPVSTERSVAEP